MPSLSVVIPCKDDAGPLARCLNGLRGQTVGPLEIIVVDNNPTTVHTLPLNWRKATPWHRWHWTLRENRKRRRRASAGN